MSSILVIEHEGRYIERIQDALASEGWKTRFVAGRPEALRAAASEQPDLVLVNSELPGAAEMLRTFASHQGGPGAIALLPEHQTPAAPAEVGADQVLSKPFTDQELRLMVRRGLNQSFAEGTAEPPTPASVQEEAKLTSEDIFGDLIAEVDSAPLGGDPPTEEASGDSASTEFSQPETSPAEPGAAAPSQVAPPPTEQPEAAQPRLTRGGPRAEGEDPEMAKRLEMTLSGVLGPQTGGKTRRPPTPKGDPPAAKATKKKRPRSTGDDVDELLNLTLSSLDTPKKVKKKRRPKAAAGNELDLRELTALAGTRRRKPRPVESSPSDPGTQSPEGDSSEAPGAEMTGSPSASAASSSAPDANFEMTDAAPDEATTDEAAQGPNLEAAPNLEPPPLPGSDGASEVAGDVDGDSPEDATDNFDEAAFDEVFDASWGAGEEAEGSNEVQPPEDFEPRGLSSSENDETGAIPPVAATAAPRTAGDDGDRFGHYQLLDRIAVGGMAEVWKARMSGVEGFQKTVAIKKILPQMTDNADFIGMFIDEAKLAAQLNHPNITHIYDLGKIERDYYIAMEFVEGRNLRDVLIQARQKGLPLPAGLALLVGARLASALDYAHRKRDFDDRELELVHRDVSPQNVLLSYEGDIKLCDFGIVKAVTKATHTQMGALKGKLQYMSPEQAWGRTVDSRSDIFSLGALLFEMLTGERLFAGDNEISVLEAVRECYVRSPEALNPDIPDGVAEVVLRALEKDPEDRYENAGALQAELETILYQLQPTPTQADLGGWLRRLDDAEMLDDEARASFTWAGSPAVEAAESTPGAEAADTANDTGSASDTRIESNADNGSDSVSGFGSGKSTGTDLRSELGSGAGEGAGDLDIGATQPIPIPSAMPSAPDDTTDGDRRDASDSFTGAPLVTADTSPDVEPKNDDTTSGETWGADGDMDGTSAAAPDNAPAEDSDALAPPPNAEVTPEEGGRRNLWLLVGAIVLLAALGAAWYFGLLGSGGDASPAGSAADSVQEEPAENPADSPPEAAAGVAPADGSAPTTELEEGSGEESAEEATTDEAASGTADILGGMDLESYVDEQIQAKEEEIATAVRSEKEPELERLRAELRRLEQRRNQALEDTAAIDAARQDSAADDEAEAAGDSASGEASDTSGDDGGDGR